MSNTSFYGGQSGKDFKISAIFRNKSELIADLNKRWNSSINVGELVLISYGLPAMDSIRDENGNLLPMPDSKSEFMVNKNSDWEKFKKTYNSTLWIKIYKEDSQLSQEYEELLKIEKEFVAANDSSAKDFGLGYALLASFTGETPYLQISHDIINADKSPYISPDGDSTPEVPKYTLHLPQSQVLTEENFTYDFTDPMKNEEPVIISVDYKANPDIPDKDQSKGSINRPSLDVTFPSPWKFYLDFDHINADQDATGVLTNRKELADGSYAEKSETKDTKYFTVRFPKAYQIEPDVEIEEIKTTEPATITINKRLNDQSIWQDGNLLYVHYNLPRPQKIRPQDVSSQFIAPELNPYITWDENQTYNDEKSSGTPEHPTLKFFLPRAAKHLFGEEEPTSINDEDYLFPFLSTNDVMIGDFYINQLTGDIWKITQSDSTAIQGRYQACLAGKMEQPVLTIIDTYKDLITGALNDPTIELKYKNKRPYFELSLPQLPNIETDYISVGSAEESKLEQTFTARATKFTFTVADGTKWFVGNEVIDNTTSAIVDGARNGDMYLHFTTATDYTNSNRGNVYKFDGTKWNKVGNLVGPTGKALNIIKTIEVSGSTANEENLINSQLNTLYGSNKPTSDQIVAVNYNDTTTVTTRSYWYYWDSTENVWKRSTVTGGLGDLVKGSYEDAQEDSHTYSTKYINTLIKDVSSITGSEDKKITTYSAGQIDEKFTAVNENITSLDDRLTENISNVNNNIQAVKTELTEKIQEATSWGSISDLIG